MHGQYNLGTTESIIESLNGLMKRQSSYDIMTGMNMKWPSVYLDHTFVPALYAFQLHLYIHAVCECHANIY